MKPRVEPLVLAAAADHARDTESRRLNHEGGGRGLPKESVLAPSLKPGQL